MTSKISSEAAESFMKAVISVGEQVLADNLLLLKLLFIICVLGVLCGDCCTKADMDCTES